MYFGEQRDVASSCHSERFQRFARRARRGNWRRVRIPGQVSTGGGRNAVTSVHRRCESLPREWRTRMPHRNHLRGKRTL